ncbi:5-methyltetrahydropteroyltriglutamate--homocysteine methyltransferase [Halovivax cerinus]|uniref:5-methyltetrahydropteroyltriglutamate--homocysteine methyltransferase n=1 Tax=Halovivax cerinus TaxID=1487865 RepID=A0ABD5NSG9_9EURY|nr:5-methyltetrahydropteroyltriglutamate--homocysteine methyltransferase [Halovivax cerinus]
MTRYISTQTGLAPLPDRAKADLSDLKGHQKHDLVDGTEGPEIRDRYDDARADVVDHQLAVGLDRVTEAQLRWDDMLAHPLAVSDAVETRGIVRYYDNNNFYREPVITGELSATGDLATEFAPFADAVEPEARQVVLPGPYTLAELATDEYYGDDASLLSGVTDLLVGELESIESFATLLLLDPSLVTDPPSDGHDERVSDAIDRLAAATDADVVVHSYWGALEEKVYAHLLDADVDAVGFDFVTERDDNLYLVQEYGCTDDIYLGLVDGQNTLLEEPEAVRDRVDWVFDRLPVSDFETAYLGPNTETFYLPYETYEAKLETVSEAASLAEVRAA